MILSTQKYVSLTFDFWSKRGFAFLGSTAHYIDENWIPHTILLALKYAPERHTSINIEKLVIDILRSIKCNEFFTIITDDAGNMKLSRKKLQAKRRVQYQYGCYVHRLQTVIRSIVITPSKKYTKNKSVSTCSNIIKKMRRIIKHFTMSPNKMLQLLA